MGIENVEIRVIKWESWNDERERDDICYNNEPSY